MDAYFKGQKIENVIEYRQGNTHNWAIVKIEGKKNIIPVPLEKIVIK